MYFFSQKTIPRGQNIKKPLLGNPIFNHHMPSKNKIYCMLLYTSLYYNIQYYDHIVKSHIPTPLSAPGPYPPAPGLRIFRLRRSPEGLSRPEDNKQARTVIKIP